MASQQQFDVIAGLAPQTITTNTNGAAVNLLNYINQGGRNMKATVHIGAATGTSPTLDIAIQENTTSGSSGWTLITNPTTAAFTQITTGTGVTSIHFVPTKQYVRAVFTLGGTPSYVMGFTFLGELKVK